MGHHFRYTTSFYFPQKPKRQIKNLSHGIPRITVACNLLHEKTRTKTTALHSEPRGNLSCIKMHATIWNNAPRSVQLVARNCKCSKGLNNVPCLVRSCIKHEIANQALRWNHSCIKMHATIWNNVPRSVQLVARNRRKGDWQNYIETKVVMRCGGSWTHNTAIARWLTISLHNALLCTTLYNHLKQSQMHLLISINTTGRVIVTHNKPKQITCFYVWFNHILQIA